MKPSPQEIDFIFATGIGIGEGEEKILPIDFIVFDKVFSEVFDIILKLVSLVFFEEDSFVLNK